MLGVIGGTDLFGNPVKTARAEGPLGDRFTFPPFSVLRGDSDPWLERKGQWIALGIKSEVSREGIKTYSVPEYMKKSDATVSIFDPVLAEAIYRWFAPVGGTVVDPFAGGSVRGIVAAFYGLHYWGCDLRPEQVEANITQGRLILDGPGRPMPTWVCGDSNEELANAPAADLVFSCPPYGDLEVYSSDKKDLSTMTYDQFIEVYTSIIVKACAKLKPGGMAAFVVGEFRDKKTGATRGFIPDTVQAFRKAGLWYWNEVVYMTPVGTNPMRTSANFEKGRKVGRTHQSLLVFSKGTPAVSGIKVLEQV